MEQHTPTPWVIDPKHPGEVQTADLQTIASAWYGDAEGADITVTGVLDCTLGEQRANAAFIVKAANAHDDLVAALTVLVQLADDHGLEQERGGLPAMLAARAALAKAEAPPMKTNEIDAAAEIGADMLRGGKPVPTDGSWYSVGRVIWQSPSIRTADDGTKTITMGYKVMELDDWISEEAAAQIAAVWNAHDGLVSALRPFAAMATTGWKGSVYEDAADATLILYHQASKAKVSKGDFHRAAEVLARINQALERAGGGE